MENPDGKTNCGGEAGARKPPVPRDLKKACMNTAAAAVCVAVSAPAAFLSLGMVESFEEQHPVWDYLYPLAAILCGMSLLYAACAWSQLAFAVKKRLPRITGFLIFTAALFPVWLIVFRLANNFCMYSLLQGSEPTGFSAWLYRGNNLNVFSHALEFGVWLLPLASWLIAAPAVVSSLRRAKRGKLPEAGSGSAPGKIENLRRECVWASAAFLLATAGAFIFWFRRLYVADVDGEPAAFRQFVTRDGPLIVILGSVAQALILGWLLCAWNALMLGLGRRFVWRFALDLAVLAVFTAGMYLTIPLLLPVLAPIPVVIELILARRRPKRGGNATFPSSGGAGLTTGSS